MDNLEAKKLWDFFKSFRNDIKTDVVIVCCSYDLRICDYGCDYYIKNMAKKIIFSGNLGNWTRDIWSEPEAIIFKKRALELGIPESRIVIEDKATNLGENIHLSKKYITPKDHITYISKPNTLLRLLLTAPLYINNRFSVSGPNYNFPEDVSTIIGIDGVINEMVGDLDRIIKYPLKGFQRPYTLPVPIYKSWEHLKNIGYTKHLLM